MSISAETAALAQRLLNALEPPAVDRLYLPELAADGEFRDEFGFLFLADGCAAPFYVSLPGTLEALHRRYPEPGRAHLPLRLCLQGFTAADAAARALALGAWNALGQYLMRRAGFSLPARSGAGQAAPRCAERVGMVGYFGPLIDRLVEQGLRVLVVEQQPGRVPRREHVELSEDPAALADCRLVYCTASTLINDSLLQILDCCTAAESIQLIGPSGSGLPDVLFAHGVDAVGGVTFDDAARLHAALENRESWGSAGRKYELTPVSYPGVDSLLAAALDRAPA